MVFFVSCFKINHIEVYLWIMNLFYQRDCQLFLFVDVNERYAVIILKYRNIFGNIEKSCPSNIRTL